MRVLSLLLLLGSTLWLPGCASSEPEDPNRVSTIPWNRPERWEGQGPLGGFAPSTQ
ncbi:MAG TPA: hypothetical protein VF614_08210 [Chthoniobacteraceae bacterium]|jgi:hypothetical protein